MTTLFYLFASFSLISGIMVIQSRNPVYSVLFLILVFFNCAGLILLLGLDFFALIFLVVYVGAIAVLFLFVVMMLNIKLAEINEKRLRYLPIGSVLVVIFLVEIFFVVDNGLTVRQSAMPFSIGMDLHTGYDQDSAQVFTIEEADTRFVQYSQLVSTWSTIESIGMTIYTYYFLFFALASLILLVAMIGAIVLTMQKSVAIKRQKVAQQNTRSFAETVFILS